MCRSLDWHLQAQHRIAPASLVASVVDNHLMRLDRIWMHVVSKFDTLYEGIYAERNTRVVARHVVAYIRVRIAIDHTELCGSEGDRSAQKGRCDVQSQAYQTSVPSLRCDPARRR